MIPFDISPIVLLVLFVFVLCLVCLMLSVPLDCSYWIVPSVFMNVHCKIMDLYSTPTYVLQYIVQPTISLEMPVPSQGHYGFHSFPVGD